MSLARGLDYYTGIIYEAITSASAPPSQAVNPPVPPSDSVTSSKPKKSKGGKDAKAEDGPDESTVGVGSIAGGGRYDNLVGMFAEAAGMGNKDPVPCVGMSVGVERIYSIMEMRRRQGEEKARGKETEVYIMNFGKEGLLKERMSLAKTLRDAGIKVSLTTHAVVPADAQAEYMFKESPKDRAQFAVADSEQIPYVAILAPKELAAGTVRIKPQVGKDAAGDNKGEEVKMTEVVEYLKQKLGQA
jgi:histidyl-tRNA synthetase